MLDIFTVEKDGKHTTLNRFVSNQFGFIDNFLYQATKEYKNDSREIFWMLRDSNGDYLTEGKIK